MGVTIHDIFPGCIVYKEKEQCKNTRTKIYMYIIY